MEKKEFTFDISEYDSNYENVRIALNPETKEIYSHSGNGTPMRIWNNLDINLFQPPADYVLDSLVEWLKTEEVQIILEKVMKLYKGTDHNGSNEVGIWDNEDQDIDCLCHELSTALYRDVTDLWIKCYWCADSYLEDHNSVKELIQDCKTLQEAISEVVEEADDNNVVLREGEVETWLVENMERFSEK